jgi:hypothetical protein|tara:strand:+ start:23176 stop:23982 length:807 start_codon:yes stop_codon:yes gene_type:complete
MAMQVSSIVKISTYAFTLLFSGFTLAQSESTHTAQINNPSKMHEILVEPGVTKIVAASMRDLNAIHTPFERPTIIKQAAFEFEVLNNVIYFQPKDDKPFGLYITESEDKDAPIYKLTVVPSKVPIGQQITLKPKNQQYFNNKSADDVKHLSPDYPSFLISLLADSAKMGSPKSFSKDFQYDKKPYYLGNVLVSPSYRTVNANYEVIVLEATNRNDVTVQLTESDFAVLTPETGLVDEIENVAAIGFYPRIVLEPGAMTNIYLVRVKND